MTEANDDLEMKALVPPSEEQDAIPLVEATEIKTDDVEKAAATPKERLPTVRVVAPSNLPPGYRLPVLYQEVTSSVGKTPPWKSAYVSVPNEGVKKGATFEATVIRPTNVVKRTLGHWSVSEFDPNTCCCSSQTDTDFCLLAWFCSPVAWACLYEKLRDLGPDYNPRPAIKSVGALSLFLFILLVVDFASRSANSQENQYSATKKHSTTSSSNAGAVADIGSMIGWFFVIVCALIRSKIRSHYRIESSPYSSENCCCDFLCVCCFSPCSALQAYRHMRNAQEHPNLGYISTPPPTNAQVMIV